MLFRLLIMDIKVKFTSSINIKGELNISQKILSSPNCTDKAYELGDVLHTTFTETSIVVGKRT